jgi:hypothetical protein
MMMYSFASDQSPLVDKGCLIAGYDRRCFHMIALLAEMSNRTGSSHNTYISHTNQLYIIVAWNMYLHTMHPHDAGAVCAYMKAMHPPDVNAIHVLIYKQWTHLIWVQYMLIHKQWYSIYTIGTIGTIGTMGTIGTIGTLGTVETIRSL